MNHVDSRTLFRGVSFIAAAAIGLTILRNEAVISLRTEREFDSILVVLACLLGAAYVFALIVDKYDDPDDQGPPMVGT
jgi:hypothetical protein